MDEAYLRPMIFVGEGAMGIYAPDNPIRAFIVAWKWGAYLGARGARDTASARRSRRGRATTST